MDKILLNRTVCIDLDGLNCYDIIITNKILLFIVGGVIGLLVLYMAILLLYKMLK